MLLTTYFPHSRLLFAALTLSHTSFFRRRRSYFSRGVGGGVLHYPIIQGCAPVFGWFLARKSWELMYFLKKNSGIDLLAILQKSLDRALFPYIFIQDVRLNGIRAFISIV